MHKKCIFINKIIHLVNNKKYIKPIIIGHSSDDSEVIVKAFLDINISLKNDIFIISKRCNKYYNKIFLIVIS